MTSSNGFWGKMIEETINFGRENRSSKFKKMDQLDSRHKKYTHCSHVMIYCKTKADFKTFPLRACILMLMRFDGCIGFPGGIVDTKETPLEAVCRKVKEEIGWAEEKGAVSDLDYQFTHVDEEDELVCHFYATEISEAKLKEIEQHLPKDPDFGNEVLGKFRVPLYTMGDGFRGFPAFLKNHFLGNTKLQLIEAIANLKLLTEEQIIQGLHSAPKITF